MTLLVGSPPKLYFLDMDTGSDLTWLQCDAPCRNCAAVSTLNLLSCLVWLWILVVLGMLLSFFFLLPGWCFL